MTKEYLPFWPSHAEKWLNCPGEPYVTRAAMETPRGKPSYMLDGIRAHAIRAGMLSGKDPMSYLRPDEIPRDEKGNPFTVDKWIPKEQLDYVVQSVNNVKFYAQLTGEEIHVERTVPIYIAEEKFNCRIDQLGVSETAVTIVDYKHGAGRPVAIEGNPQLGIYALAARKLYPGKHISVGIDQPRTGAGAPKYVLLDDDYLDTLRTNVSSAVKRSRGLQFGELGFNIGPWCRFCDGQKGYCPKLLEMALRVPHNDAATLAPWWVLDIGDQIKSWVNGIQSEAFHAVESGVKIPGWAIREVKGRRTWADPAHVAEILGRLTGAGTDMFQRIDPKPLGITESTKVAKSCGVSVEQVNELVYTPYTRKLVKVDDSTPESSFEFGKVE